MESLTRNTAYKVWISDLVSGKYSKGQEQFDSGYVDVKGKNISRVNLMGSVIDKFSGNNYVSVNLDDGSGVIMLKAWQENTNLFLDVEIGDLILIVGKVKEYNSRYIAVEFIRKIDNPLWLKIRKLELIKMYGEPTRVEFQTVIDKKVVDEDITMNVVEEKVEETNSRVFVLGLIEELDSGEGADFDEVVRRSCLEEASSIIQELLTEGEIFEVHKGKLRFTG